MSRKYIDCREFPGDIKCSIALAADTEKELLEAAVQHAVACHGYQDTPELRQELKSCFHNGTPPVAAPKPAAAG
jgi:predicted small metal-binding protein